VRTPEPPEAEQFQPMRMWLPGHELFGLLPAGARPLRQPGQPVGQALALLLDVEDVAVGGIDRRRATGRCRQPVVNGRHADGRVEQVFK